MLAPDTRAADRGRPLRADRGPLHRRVARANSHHGSCGRSRRGQGRRRRHHRRGSSGARACSLRRPAADSDAALRRLRRRDPRARRGHGKDDRLGTLTARSPSVPESSGLGIGPRRFSDREPVVIPLRGAGAEPQRNGPVLLWADRLVEYKLPDCSVPCPTPWRTTGSPCLTDRRRPGSGVCTARVVSRQRHGLNKRPSEPGGFAA
jgi:hypothetical protein